MSTKIKDKIDEFFKQDEASLSGIFSQIFMHICLTEYKRTDLYYLSKVLNFEQLRKICNYYNGDIIRTPTKQELHQCYFLAICYFLKEELNWDWEKIKTYLQVDDEDEYFSSLSIGKQIRNLKDSMKKDLQYILNNIDKNELLKYIQEQQSNVSTQITTKN